jgi:hypothetical protein
LDRQLREPAYADGEGRQFAVFRGFTALAPATVNDEVVWRKIDQELSKNAPEAIRESLALELPEPEVGVDLADDDGEVTVSGDVVELCWPARKVAVIALGAAASIAGWHLVTADDDTVENMRQLINQGVF